MISLNSLVSVCCFEAVDSTIEVSYCPEDTINRVHDYSIDLTEIVDKFLIPCSYRADLVTDSVANRNAQLRK